MSHNGPARRQQRSAVSDLDYRPHRHARALRRKAGWGPIGLLIPDVRLPLYGMLAGAIEREARARRQLALTGNTGFDATVEIELTRSFTDAGVDRLLVAGAGDGGAIAGICHESRTPIVWVHSNRGVVGTRVVGADHVQAGVLAAEHLAAIHGRNNTAFVGLHR